jgi:hypothetical protein
VSARPLPMPINPALLRHAEERRQSLENRILELTRAIITTPGQGNREA